MISLLSVDDDSIFGLFVLIDVAAFVDVVVVVMVVDVVVAVVMVVVVMVVVVVVDVMVVVGVVFAIVVVNCGVEATGIKSTSVHESVKHLCEAGKIMNPV